MLHSSIGTKAAKIWEHCVNVNTEIAPNNSDPPPFLSLAPVCVEGWLRLPKPNSKDVRDDERREENFEELCREDSSFFHHTRVPDAQSAGAFGLLQQELSAKKNSRSKSI